MMKLEIPYLHPVGDKYYIGITCSEDITKSNELLVSVTPQGIQDRMREYVNNSLMASKPLHISLASKMPCSLSEYIAGIDDGSIFHNIMEDAKQENPDNVAGMISDWNERFIEITTGSQYPRMEDLTHLIKYSTVRATFISKLKCYSYADSNGWSLDDKDMPIIRVALCVGTLNTKILFI